MMLNKVMKNLRQAMTAGLVSTPHTILVLMVTGVVHFWSVQSADWL